MASNYIDLPVEGGSASGVSSLNSLTGALTLVAGSGISVTPAGSNITIASTGSFSGPVLISDGDATSPGLAFASDTNTGLYRVGTDDMAFSIGGVQGFEAMKVGSNVNIGLCSPGAASSSATNPFSVFSSNAGSQFFQYGNTNIGATSATVFQILNGVPDPAVTLNFENHAYTTAGYLAGACVLSAGSGCASNFNIMNEFATAPQIVFNLGGRAAINEAFVIAKTYFTPALKTSDPTAPEGSMYYNTSTHKLMLYDGTSWVALN